MTSPRLEAAAASTRKEADVRATKAAHTLLDRFYLQNQRTGMFAHGDSVGEHDGLVTAVFDDAAKFGSYGEASDYNANFGPDWQPVTAATATTATEARANG